MVDDPLLREYRDLMHDLLGWIQGIPHMDAEELYFDAGAWQVRISDLLQEDEGAEKEA